MATRGRVTALLADALAELSSLRGRGLERGRGRRARTRQLGEVPRARPAGEYSTSQRAAAAAAVTSSAGSAPDRLGEGAGQRGRVAARHHPRVVGTDDLGQGARVGDDDRAARPPSPRRRPARRTRPGPTGTTREVDAREELPRRRPSPVCSTSDPGTARAACDRCGGRRRARTGRRRRSRSSHPRTQRRASSRAHAAASTSTPFSGPIRPRNPTVTGRRPSTAARGSLAQVVGPVGQHVARPRRRSAQEARTAPRVASGAEPRERGPAAVVSPTGSWCRCTIRRGPTGGGEGGEQSVAPQDARSRPRSQRRRARGVRRPVAAGHLLDGQPGRPRLDRQLARASTGRRP